MRIGWIATCGVVAVAVLALRATPLAAEETVDVVTRPECVEASSSDTCVVGQVYQCDRCVTLSSTLMRRATVEMSPASFERALPSTAALCHAYAAVADDLPQAPVLPAGEGSGEGSGGTPPGAGQPSALTEPVRAFARRLREHPLLLSDAELPESDAAFQAMFLARVPALDAFCSAPTASRYLDLLGPRESTPAQAAAGTLAGFAPVVSGTTSSSVGGGLQDAVIRGLADFVARRAEAEVLFWLQEQLRDTVCDEDPMLLETCDLLSNYAFDGGSFASPAIRAALRSDLESLPVLLIRRELRLRLNVEVTDDEVVALLGVARLFARGEAVLPALASLHAFTPLRECQRGNANETPCSPSSLSLTLQTVGSLAYYAQAFGTSKGEQRHVGDATTRSLTTLIQLVGLTSFGNDVTRVLPGVLPVQFGWSHAASDDAGRCTDTLSALASAARHPSGRANALRLLSACARGGVGNGDRVAAEFGELFRTLAAARDVFETDDFATDEREEPDIARVVRAISTVWDWVASKRPADPNLVTDVAGDGLAAITAAAYRDHRLAARHASAALNTLAERICSCPYERKRRTDQCRRTGSSQCHRISALANAVAFASELAASEDSADVEALLGRVASPVGAYANKQRQFTLSLGALVGVQAGGEYGLGGCRGCENPSSALGLLAPFGFDLSAPVGAVNDTHQRRHNLGLFISVIDLGNLTWSTIRSAYRSDKPEDATASEPAVDVEQVPQIGVAQVLSPGAYLRWGIRGTPFTLGVGTSYAPELREARIWRSDGSEVSQRFSVVRVGAFFAVDTTLFTIR